MLHVGLAAHAHVGAVRRAEILEDDVGPLAHEHAVASGDEAVRRHHDVADLAAELTAIAGEHADLAGAPVVEDLDEARRTRPGTGCPRSSSRRCRRVFTWMAAFVQQLEAEQLTPCAHVLAVVELSLGAHAQVDAVEAVVVDDLELAVAEDELAVRRRDERISRRARGRSCDRTTVSPLRSVKIMPSRPV